jgi:hypothetical protein
MHLNELGGFFLMSIKLLLFSTFLFHMSLKLLNNENKYQILRTIIIVIIIIIVVVNQIVDVIHKLVVQ